jgi:Flp pilus assembly protein TadD
MKAFSMALALSLGLVASAALASGGKPMPTREAKGTPHATKESIYNQGLALAQAGDFAAAEVKYRQAIKLDPSMPEAWNGLGHALKKQHQYKEALAAYDRALALRPNFPLAMEYLGELYVETGQLDKARALEQQLRSQDQTEHADQLALAISSRASGW